MSALLAPAVFALAAVFAFGGIAVSLRRYVPLVLSLQNELAREERGATYRVSWRESEQRPVAKIYSLRFMPKVDSLPYHPDHEWRAAA